MKNKSFSLKIEKPCNVNLASMAKHDVGLFCTNCDKHVIDFSKLSDEEVIAIVEKMNGHFCGRFTKSQLDRVFVAAKKRPTSPRLNKILAGLFAFGMLESAHIDAKETKSIEMVQTDAKQQNNIPENDFEKNNISGDTTKNVVRGTILDAATKKPVMYGTVSIEGTSFVAQIDSAGKFKFEIPDSLMTDSISLIASSNGYSFEKIKISKTQLPVERTFLLQEEMIIEGGAIYEPQIAPCNNIIKKRKKN